MLNTVLTVGGIVSFLAATTPALSQQQDIKPHRGLVCDEMRQMERFLELRGAQPTPQKSEKALNQVNKEVGKDDACADMGFYSREVGVRQKIRQGDWSFAIIEIEVHAVVMSLPPFHFVKKLPMPEHWYTFQERYEPTI